MKQFQFNVKEPSEFSKEVDKIRQWCSSRVISAVMFSIFTEIPDPVRIKEMCGILDKKMPEAVYSGCSSNGNIVNGDFCGGVFSIICTIFEYPSTRVKLFALPLDPEIRVESARELARRVNSEDWVKAVELLVTIRGMSMTDVCRELDNIREGVEIFGGGAISEDINTDVACVFSSDKGFMEYGMIAVMMGGEDLNIRTTYVTGWKPLGQELKVTAAEGRRLIELDNAPAYDAYYRYLHIKNDEHFSNNTLEFPFLYKSHGIEILRTAINSNPDGSLTMTGDMEMNVSARISYGDPWTILNAVRESCLKIRDFAPEVILCFSCAARRTYWGNDEIGKETLPLQKIAPSSGFYTSGEFLRTGKYLDLHNVTLVIAALREGEAHTLPEPVDEVQEQFSGKVSMINRLATFIKATTDELALKNRQLEIMAITDGLTQLYNRREIQRRITEAIGEKHTPGTYLIMLDIDDFKLVNDNCGHSTGDAVLAGIAKVLQDYADKEDMSAGRWGGEEFMLLLTDADDERAKAIADGICTAIAARDFGKAGRMTVSVGVTRAIDGEDPDRTCYRVDAALYKAKAEGKNRVIWS